MSQYFMQFHVMGEVAEMLFLKEPENRLLVDISTETRNEGDPTARPYLSRTCFLIRSPELIDAFMADISVGDTIQAMGTFSQSDYVPHKTSYIDTTFLMRDFWKVHKDVGELQHRGRVFEPARSSAIH